VTQRDTRLNVGFVGQREVEEGLGVICSRASCLRVINRACLVTD
jgi:hypothetical protein